MKQIIFFLLNPIQPKKVVHIILTVLSFIFIYHTSVWFLFTKQILDVPNNKRVGDLVRLNYQLASLQLRENLKVTLPFQHLESKNYTKQNIEIITIGDSFSNGGAGGTNPYYQDYIESIYNKRVLNISPSKMDTNYMETIISLYNNGLLDLIKPKLIILGSVERSVLLRFSKNINWDYNISQEQCLYNFKHSIFNQHKQKNISIINNGNYKFLINPLLYKFSKNTIERSGVYRTFLDRKLFNVQASKTLLFHKSALDNIPLTTKNNIKKLNDNLNKLAILLRKKHINLAFMPSVDKYNLYAPYISKNTFHNSTFFEKLRTLKKEYYFIDTKVILSRKLPNSQDLYYADDTHWNYTASKEIIQKIPFGTLMKEK